MTRIVDLYFKLLKLLIVLCMVAMIVLVFGNVVLRYAFNSGISVSEELSRWLFVWMTFLGAVVALNRVATQVRAGIDGDDRVGEVLARDRDEILGTKCRWGGQAVERAGQFAADLQQIRDEQMNKTKGYANSKWK